MEPLSRKERRKAERQAKREQSQREKTKHQKLAFVQKLFLYLVGILLLGGVGYWAYGRLAAASPGKFVASLGNRHIALTEMGLITYNSHPPTSGPHLPNISLW